MPSVRCHRHEPSIQRRSRGRYDQILRGKLFHVASCDAMTSEKDCRHGLKWPRQVSDTGKLQESGKPWFALLPNFCYTKAAYKQLLSKSLWPAPLRSLADHDMLRLWDLQRSVCALYYQRKVLTLK